MKKIKVLSVTLALIELLSTGKYIMKKNNKEVKVTPKSSIETSIDNSEYLIGGNVYQFTNENGELTYYRLNMENGEYENISIFDDENLSSKQYGASQLDFKYRFHSIIKEQFIWEELQKYFPIEDFASYDEAIFFYEKYFNVINQCGCGYVAAANYVFRLYEGCEKEFEETFGYPMYTVNGNGYIDFNYEVFVLKFFNYSVLEMEKAKKIIMNSMAKDLCQFRLTAFMNSDEYNKKMPNDFETWTEKEWKEWKEYEALRDEKFHELYDEWVKAENADFDLGIYPDASFGSLHNYLGIHGINNINISCIDEPNHFEMDSIVASDNFNLYQINEDNEKYNVRDSVGSHYVYVCTTANNQVIVSSWGDKYVFENDKADWTSKILIKTNRKNN